MPRLGRNPILTLVVIAYLPTVAGDNGDDFTNNLFSDLAPLLALFGERVAQQFMSQAMGWADITIFAMAPLGIITAIVGAIRVAGPGWLKSVIGRAREAFAIPELELLSSTSSDICELWNGVTLVKVLGSPTVVELLYFSLDYDTNDCQVHINQEAMTNSGIEVSQKCTRADPTTKRINILRILKQYTSRTPLSRIFSSRPKSQSPQSDLEAHDQSDPDTKKNRKNKDIKPSAPNISLNIAEPITQTTLWAVAFTGIILQFSVLVFDGFTVYHPSVRNGFQKNGRPVDMYAFPVTAIGTLLVVLGMIICAYLVESATEEVDLHYMRDKKVCSCMRLLWLQKHGKVGDHLFDSYVIFARGPRDSIRTSRRRDPEFTQETNHTISEPVLSTTNLLQKYSRTGSEGLCIVGAGTSLVGFTAQFMGLRSMPWTATIAQLVATGIMTGLRALVRTAGITQEPDTYKLPIGYELDWLATRLGNLQRVPLDTMLSEESMGEEFWTHSSWKWSVVTGQCAHRQHIPGSEAGEHQPLGSGQLAALRKPRQFGRANEVVAARIRLQSLTKWIRVGSMASCVVKAIEAVMNIIFNSHDVIMKHKHATILDFKWPIFIRFDGKEEPYFFKLSRRTTGALWKMEDHEGVEAILSLWRFALRQERQSLVQAVEALQGTTLEAASPAGLETKPEPTEESEQNDGSEKKFAVLRFLGPSNAISQTDYQLWIDQGTKFMTCQCEMPNRGYPAIGFPISPLQPNNEISSSDTDSDVNEKFSRGLETTNINGRLPMESKINSLFEMLNRPTTNSHFNIDEVTPGSRKTDPIPHENSGSTPRNFNIGEKSFKDSSLINGYGDEDQEDESEMSYGGTDAVNGHRSVPSTIAESVADSYPALCVVTTSSFERICAQDLFSTFMWYAVENVQSVVAKSSFTTHPHLSITKRWEAPCVRNTFLDTVVGAVESTELGLGDEIYMSIIPPLRSSGVLASMDLEPTGMKSLVHHVKHMVALFESRQEWEESRKACFWLHRICFGYMEQNPNSFLKAGILLADFSASVSHAATMCGQWSGDESKHRKEVLLGMSTAAIKEVGIVQHGNAIVKILRKAYNKRTGGIKQLRPWTGKRGLKDHTIYASIAKLLDARYNKSDDDENILGWTSLHCATATMSVDDENSPLREPQTLVIDAKDRDGMTPLHWAVLNNKQPWVQALLELRSDINIKDNFGRTPLYLSLTKELTEVTSLLQTFAVRVDGWGLLISETPDDNEIERLLDGGGISLEIKDRDGRTPLHLAIQAGRTGLARKLLQRGAKFAASDDDENILGWTPLHLATISMSADSKDSPLRERHTLAVDAKDKDGMTPLHWAVLNNKQPWVQALVKSQWDRNSKDNLGCTPLYLALRKGLVGIINILQKGGGIVDGWQRFISETPVDSEIELLLASRNIRLDIAGMDGMVPLRLAIGAGRKGLAKVLLDSGADPNAIVNRTRECALYPASGGGDLEMVKLLLKYKANPSYPTRFRWTPLHRAVRGGYKAVAQALLEAGADPAAAADTGQTPLDMTADEEMRALIHKYLAKPNPPPNS